MIYYEDLLPVPFKLNGRDMDGMDCYGLCIEMCKRDGKKLTDISCVHVGENMVNDAADKINVIQIPESDARAGDIVQCIWKKEIHIAFMLDKKIVIHSTADGVRVSPILALINRKYFRVI